MVYSEVNFKTKKALKEAVSSGIKIRIFQYGPFASMCPQNGKVVVEGPHYPEPHRWYAECVVKDGIIVSVK